MDDLLSTLSSIEGAPSDIKTPTTPTTGGLGDMMDTLSSISSDHAAKVEPAPKQDKHLTIGGVVRSVSPGAGIALGKASPDISNQEVKLPEDFVSKLGHGAVALGDSALNVVGGTIKQGDYAVRRAFGQSPEKATEASNNGPGSFFENPVSKFVNGAQQLATGTNPNIQNTPEYKGEESQRVMQFVGENVGKGADWISQKTGLPKADVENMIQSASYAIPSAVSAAGSAISDTLKGWKSELEGAKGSAPTSAEIPSQYAAGGSAGSNVIGRLSTASEEFRADAMAQIEEARTAYGADWGNHVNWDALDKHLNADSLPVPGRLTQGQATGNGALISEEWNKRSTNGLGPTFAAQNEVQRANLQHIRETSAPDVYTNSPAEHAQTLIDSYDNLYKQEKGAIDAKWDAIRKTTSDKMIFDAKQMYQDSVDAIKKAKLSTYDPGGQLKELSDGIAKGGFTADEYVAWRQNLGREAMKGGNEGAAASKIIEATNNSKLLPDAKQYQGMVSEALADGRALHTKLANDPAYNAVANESASVKDFVNKYIVQGKPEKVTQMTNNLVGNDVAQQTIRASLLDHLRDKAALNDKYEGNFAGASFNKAVNFVTPNARLVFQNGELQTLRALGDYSSHVSQAGRDSWKNWSNTHTAEIQTPTNAMASKVGSLAATGAESLLAAKTGGFSVPIVGALKEGAKARAAARAALEEQESAANYIHESTRPAAGLIKKE